jgi:anti-sigma B factor antagonist
MRELLLIDEMAVGRRLVISPAGEIDMATVDPLRDALARASRSDAEDIWVDLSDVRFMGSAGITALLDADRELVAGRRRLALICPAGPVRRVLEVAGVDHVLVIFADHRTAAATP